MSEPRWPWAPLEEALGGGTWRAMAERLGVHDRQIGRWKAYGLGDDHADRCAIAIGSHPAIVWGPAWDGDEGQAQLELDDVA